MRRFRDLPRHHRDLGRRHRDIAVAVFAVSLLNCSPEPRYVCLANLTPEPVEVAFGYVPEDCESGATNSLQQMRLTPLERVSLDVGRMSCVLDTRHLSECGTVRLLFPLGAERLVRWKNIPGSLDVEMQSDQTIRIEGAGPLREIDLRGPFTLTSAEQLSGRRELENCDEVEPLDLGIRGPAGTWRVDEVSFHDDCASVESEDESFEFCGVDLTESLRVGDEITVGAQLLPRELTIGSRRYRWHWDAIEDLPFSVTPVGTDCAQAYDSCRNRVLLRDEAGDWVETRTLAEGGEFFLRSAQLLVCDEERQERSSTFASVVSWIEVSP